MSVVASKPEFTVRHYRGSDEPLVLELLHLALGEGPAARSPAFFRWKHLANPFGRSFMLVAESQSKIIGLRAFMRWRFVVGGRTLSAVRAVDTATHPEFQRMGVFSTLTRAALGELGDEVDFVYNTPNKKSLAGYLKMGWSMVGTLPVSLRVRRPIRFALAVAGVGAEQRAMPAVEAESVRVILDADIELSELLAEAHLAGPEITTERSAEYVRWRYASTSGLDYRAIREPQEGRTRGIAIFRVRPRRGLWETSLVEVIVPRGDRTTARRLMRRVLANAGTDHAACHFPRRTAQARAALRAGFLPTPAGITLVVNPLQANIRERLMSEGSWALSLGDLEVF
jgi:GNAT superfamily N-acetyltransferase